MTDLEKHVNQPGRAKLVKKVREKINELGITYIYYQFISVTGRVVGKGIPADHWERTAEKGFQLVYGATANLFLDRHNNYIGYGPEAMELVGIPDPETFVQLPWDKRVGRVFVTCFSRSVILPPLNFQIKKVTEKKTFVYLDKLTPRKRAVRCRMKFSFFISIEPERF